MENCCRLCGEQIALLDDSEPYSCPGDGTRVHRRCVEKLLAEVLSLMQKLPPRYRWLDPLEWEEEPIDEIPEKEGA